MTERLIAGLAVALLCAAAGLLLRRNAPEAALALSVAGGVFLLCTALPALSETLEFLRALTPDGVAGECLSPLLRVTGIVLLARLGAELCRDAGEGSLALRVELLGTALALASSLPLFSLLAGLLAE